MHNRYNEGVDSVYIRFWGNVEKENDFVERIANIVIGSKAIIIPCLDHKKCWNLYDDYRSFWITKHEPMLPDDTVFFEVGREGFFLLGPSTEDDELFKRVLARLMDNTLDIPSDEIISWMYDNRWSVA